MSEDLKRGFKQFLWLIPFSLFLGLFMLGGTVVSVIFSDPLLMFIIVVVYVVLFIYALGWTAKRANA